MDAIGKLRLPGAVVEQLPPHVQAEWVLMRSHPEIGLALLGRTGRSSREVLAVLYHHERLDGSGYPYGLKAEAIPIEARIVAVADTYDALTSNRPYRVACSPAEAKRVLVAESGSRLDARAVSALFGALDERAGRQVLVPRAALAS